MRLAACTDEVNASMKSRGVSTERFFFALAWMLRSPTLSVVWSDWPVEVGWRMRSAMGTNSVPSSNFLIVFSLRGL